MNKILSNHATQKWNRFFLACGIFMSVSEVWKQWYLTYRLNNGEYDWWYFPFQLCSIAMYILLLLPRLKNTRLRSILLAFLMNYSLLGGIAVFADTSGLHYPTAILTVHSYLWHILLIIIGLAAGIAYYMENKANLYSGSFMGSTFLYLGCCITAAILNQILDSYGDINLFYINPDYTMKQKVFSSLVSILGNLPVIVIYILATAIGANILFHIWKLAYHCFEHHLKAKKTL